MYRNLHRLTIAVVNKGNTETHLGVLLYIKGLLNPSNTFGFFSAKNLGRLLICLGYIVLFANKSHSVLAQTTYYSRIAATPPRNWDEADSWTLSSDGTGPAAAVPSRADHVVILNTHTIIVDNVADNGSAGISANGLGRANVAPFPASDGIAFYQTGNITISNGGALQSTVRLMLEGTTFVDGNLTAAAGNDFINLGKLEVTSIATFSVGDDFILSGSSETNIDAVINAVDDIYLDHTEATLCGMGSVNVGDEILNTNGSNPSIQICAGFTVNCADGDCNQGGSTPGIFMGAGAFVLPVAFIAIEAKRNTLFWDVVEYNISGYNILFATDAKNWQIIAKVDARSGGRQQYSFPISKKGYYRLLTIEDNPQFSRPVFHQTVRNAVEATQIFPTILNTGEKLHVSAKALLKTEVYDTNGILLKQFEGKQSEIPMSFAPGLYIIQCTTSAGTISKKIVIRQGGA